MPKIEEKGTFGCSIRSDNYGETYIGIGPTFEKAYEELKEMLDNAGEDPAAAEACEFWKMKQVRVEIESTVKIKERS